MKSEISNLKSAMNTNQPVREVARAASLNLRPLQGTPPSKFFCSGQFTRRALVALALLWLCHPWFTRAEIPEPDNLIYGVIQLGISPITAANTNVVVEARKNSTNGLIVATYRMGESLIAGNSYSLRIPIEAFNPLTDTNASRVGTLLYLSVRDQSGMRVVKTTSIASRGKFVRVDFTEPDSDGDGLPDSWELKYFGHPTNPNPNDDPDHDGRTNLQEYLVGTNPLVPDGRHPADNSPVNNILTFAEADTYADSWLAGNAWSSAPTNIPIAYVTSAALLAINGGSYVFTNSPATNAPHWWVNVPRPPAAAPGTNFITSTMPSSASVGTLVTITLQPLPDASTRVYAVEDQVPVGWEVLSISHGGSFDAVNHKVKWGPFYDSGERDLTYDVIPDTINVLATLTGIGSFNGLNIPISGARTVSISGGGLPLRWVFSVRDSQGPAFLLSGEAQHAYVVEVSTNLTSWSVFQAVTTDTTGQYLFRPANPLAGAKNFYRARTP